MADDPPAGRDHRLEFTVTGANWGQVESRAAARIRGYTNEPRRGRYAVRDSDVLRDAVFTARPGGCGLWIARVVVTV